MSKLLLDLEPDDCRYPFGDSPFVFCGNAAISGSSYCLPHSLICTKATEHHFRGANRPQFAATMRKHNIPTCLVVEDKEGML